MASRYGTTTRKTGSRYGTGTATRTKSRYGSGSSRKQKQDDGFSLTGLLGNAADEARSMVYGLPRGLAESAKALADLQGYVATRDPIDEGTKNLGRSMVKSYKDTYGRGWKGLYENPVSVLLDVLTVASLGTGAAVKAGVISPAKASTFLTASGKAVSKTRSRSSLRRVGQAGTDRALGKLPATTPRIGEYARAGRIEARGLRRDARAQQNFLIDYDRVVAKLRSNPERVAVTLRAMLGGSQDAFENTVRMFREADSDLARLVDSRKVRRLYSQPTARMSEALVEMRRVADKQKQLLKLDDTLADERSYLPLRLAGGAKFEDDLLTGGPDLESLRGRVAAGELEAPVYVPHANLTKQHLSDLGRGGGTGPQLTPGAAKRNRGTLFTQGALTLDPSVLSQSFLRAVKWQHYTDVHQNLVENGVRVPAAEAANVLRTSKGWRILREHPSQRVSPLVRQAEGQGDWLDSIGDLKGFDFDQTPDVLKSFTTDSLEDAARVGDEIVFVPDSYVKQLAGEFTRTSKAAYALNKYPVRWWRAAVLNLRPAWLVNNVVGNTLLYAIAAGPAEAKALLTSFKKTWPKHADEFEKIFRNKFPEQATGTFIGTQRPTGISGRFGRTVLGRVGGKTVSSLADVDKWFETALRRAKVKAELNRHPKLSKRAYAMRGETRDWSKVADDITPEQVDEISQRVNDALGDFTGLSGFEKNYLRSVFPFYAWFRAITAVTLKLPLERPIRANLLARLGEIGAETNLAELGVTEDEVPEFLKGMIPIGDQSGGRVPVASSGPGNPFGTVVDVGEFVAALAAGKPGAAGRELPGLNPFLAGPLQAITGRNIQTGAPMQGGAGGVLRSTGEFVGQGLPQFRLGTALSGRQYEGTPSKPTLYDQDLMDILLRYMGAPYARVSVNRARQMRERADG